MGIDAIVPQRGERMTFDMESAREISNTGLKAKILSDGSDAGSEREFGDIMVAASWLPAALDEIERQAKRIADLEAVLRVEKSNHDETKYSSSETFNRDQDTIAKQRAALKVLGKRFRERGKALVEERAKIFHQFGDIELDPPSEDDCRFARQQLRQEKVL
jgi:flagellar motility protein MotE (MotC chaperone)